MLPLTALISIRNWTAISKKRDEDSSIAELLGITGELQKTLAILPDLWYPNYRFSKRRRRVGMADEADSKSVVGNHVRVQVPLPAVNGNLS